jgi:hypothetical protein
MIQNFQSFHDVTTDFDCKIHPYCIKIHIKVVFVFSRYDEYNAARSFLMGRWTTERNVSVMTSKDSSSSDVFIKIDWFSVTWLDVKTTMTEYFYQDPENYIH